MSLEGSQCISGYSTLFIHNKITRFHSTRIFRYRKSVVPEGILCLCLMLSRLEEERNNVLFYQDHSHWNYLIDGVRKTFPLRKLYWSLSSLCPSDVHVTWGIISCIRVNTTLPAFLWIMLSSDSKSIVISFRPFGNRLYSSSVKHTILV